MAALIITMGVWRSQSNLEDSLEPSEPTLSELENPFAQPSAYSVSEAGNSSRPVYPYSVVAGGVHAPDELRQAAIRDRVVAAHYSDFDIARARIVRLSTARSAYVSYRMKNRVYWTKKRVTLAKGETLITDGKNYARTRCGNRVSDSAQTSVSPQEPSPEVLDTPAPSGAPMLMAYLPNAVRQGLTGNSIPPSSGIGRPEPSYTGGPGNGFFGGPGFGGGAFLPAGRTSGGSPSAGGAGTPGGAGSPSGGAPNAGGDQAPGAGTGAPGGIPVFPPPSSGNPGTGNEPGSPDQGIGGSSGNGGATVTPPTNGANPPSSNGNQPSSGDSTQPNHGAPGNSPNPSSNPGGNTPPGKQPEPDFNTPTQGGGSNPPPPGTNGPGAPSSPEVSSFTPPGEGGDGPVDVTTPPNEGGPNPSTPTAPVPEPATVWLLSAGTASLLALRRRKK